jgi:hypothetical protein
MRVNFRLVGLAGLMIVALSAFPREAYSAGPFQFHAVTPCRIFDTRLAGAQTTGAPLPNPGPHCFQLRNIAGCGIPATAAAVTLNATVVQPSTGGDLRLYPASANPGLFDPSTMNYNAGEPALANGAILPVSTGGGCPAGKDMKILIGMVGSGSIHLIVDVTGYFE